MESFFSRYRNALVLILVLSLQVVLLAIQVKKPVRGLADGSKQVRQVRVWTVSALAGPQRLLRYLTGGIVGPWDHYIALWHARQENDDLKKEIAQLRLEQASILEDARQGQRLQTLLGFKQKYVYATVPAQVIGASGTDQSKVLFINKGASSGLKVDMPVITADGIVGKVREVYDNTAQILEINDQTFGAGVLLETTRTRGILRGNATGQPEIIDVLPDSRIKPGEKVITSGGDQVFPRGLPVGVVDRVGNDPDRDQYVAIVLRPAANLSRLEEVLVVTEMGSTLPPSQKADLAKSEAEQGAAAAEMKRRAADEISDKLPSTTDPSASPEQKAREEEKARATGDPEPVHAVPPLHPDRYSPSNIPPASSMTPGQGTPPSEGVVPRPAAPRVPRPVVPAPEGSTAAGSTAGSAAGQPAPRKPVVPAYKQPFDVQPKPDSAAPAAIAPGAGTATTVPIAPTKPKPKPKPAIPAYKQPFDVKPKPDSSTSPQSVNPPGEAS